MDDAGALEAEVARAARATGLAPGDRVLVAVSGGADSVALGALLVAAAGHGLPLEVVVGHVDHGWRGGAEADADRVVVEALARALRVPVAFAGPPTDVRRTEDAARRFRYAALARAAREARCVAVATGHHLRDQAETFLLRLARGSGPAGLAGIPSRRPLGTSGVMVVRPLLDIAPARLRAYVADRGLAFHEDPTNAALDRDRTRLRARLVAAETHDHALAHDLAAAAARFRTRLARREAAVEATLSRSRRTHPWAGVVEVALADARRLAAGDGAVLLRVLGRSIAADADGPWFERVHADLATAAIRGDDADAAVDLPHGRWLRRVGPRVLLGTRQVPNVAPLDLAGEGRTVAAVGTDEATLDRRDGPAAAFDLAAFARRTLSAPPGPPWVAALDADVLGPKVGCRVATDTDRFVPLGRRHEVDVLAFLAKQGVPAALRRGALVLTTAAGDVAWVVGHRVDARAAVTGGTRRVAALRVTVDACPRRQGHGAPGADGPAWTGSTRPEHRVDSPG